MAQKQDPKKEAEKNKESDPENQPYIHEPILERLSIFENIEYIVQAGDYYIQKYGLLTAPPIALLQSYKATMVTSSD